MSEEKKAPETEEKDQEETKVEATPAEEAANVKTAEQEAEERATEASEEVIPEEIEADAEVEELPNSDIRPGMLVRVHERIIDTNSKGEEKERVQMFEGLVIGTRGAGSSRTMTVRRNAKGWMVEKIFPLSSPNVDKIEVVKQYRVRRAKLSYLRGNFKRKLKEVK